jgi:regulator of replication initiation timing
LSPNIEEIDRLRNDLEHYARESRQAAVHATEARTLVALRDEQIKQLEAELSTTKSRLTSLTQSFLESKAASRVQAPGQSGAQLLGDGRAHVLSVINTARERDPAESNHVQGIDSLAVLGTILSWRKKNAPIMALSTDDRAFTPLPMQLPTDRYADLCEAEEKYVTAFASTPSWVWRLASSVAGEGPTELVGIPGDTVECGESVWKEKARMLRELVDEWRMLALASTGDGDAEMVSRLMKKTDTLEIDGPTRAGHNVYPNPDPAYKYKGLSAELDHANHDGQLRIVDSDGAYLIRERALRLELEKRQYRSLQAPMDMAHYTKRDRGVHSMLGSGPDIEWLTEAKQSAHDDRREALRLEQENLRLRSQHKTELASLSNTLQKSKQQEVLALSEELQRYKESYVNARHHHGRFADAIGHLRSTLLLGRELNFGLMLALAEAWMAVDQNCEATQGIRASLDLKTHQIVDLHQQLDEVMAEPKSLRLKIAELQAQLGEQWALAQALSAQDQEKEEGLRKARRHEQLSASRVDQAVATAEGAKDRLLALEKQLTLAQGRCDELELELMATRDLRRLAEADASAQRDKLEHRQAIMQREVMEVKKQADTEVADTHSIISNLRKDASSIARERSLLEQELDQVRQQFTKATQEAALDHAASDQQICQLKARLSEHKISGQDLEDRLSATLADLHDAKARVSQKQDECSGLRQELTQLQGLLEKMQQELSAALEDASKDSSRREATLRRALGDAEKVPAPLCQSSGTAANTRLCVPTLHCLPNLTKTALVAGK